MKIERVGLRNFKGFKDAVFDLGQVTLLTGKNSSGKSSVLQGLLLPFQSFGFPFELSPNGQYASMGDFKEISHGRNLRNHLGIDIVLTDNQDDRYDISTSWVHDRLTSSAALSRLTATSPLVRLRVSRLAKTGMYKLDLKLNRRAYRTSGDFWAARAASQMLRNAAAHARDISPGGKVAKREIAKMASQVLKVGDINALRVNRVRDVYDRIGHSSHPGSVSFVRDIVGTIHALNERMNYVSSFRNPPDRTYNRQTIADMKVGRFGERAIDQMLDWDTHSHKSSVRLRKILRDLSLARIIKTTRLPGGQFEVRARPFAKGTMSALPDIGFGVSQVLPVLVADLQLPPKSVLVLSQPEMHLHPSAQAALADYFVAGIAKDERQYVIETHSEYLINRLRLAISTGRLDPARLVTYYLQYDPGGTTVHRIAFTKDGKVEGAPQDFFDTYMMDVMDIALASE